MTSEQVRALLMPYADTLTGTFCDEIARFADLLLRWNARTNLTAIRNKEALIQRQVGESLFAARFLSPASSLLDFGSGAGFPGIPLALAVPGLRVTLAESQGKKASFLREAVRTLKLNTEVYAGRVESMAPDRLYDAVVMRAVDHSAEMLPMAAARVKTGGRLLRYLPAQDALEMAGWRLERVADVPLSEGRLASWVRAD